MPIFPVFSTITLPKPSDWSSDLTLLAMLTKSELFLFSGITAALIGDKWGLSLSKVLLLASSIV